MSELASAGESSGSEASDTSNSQETGEVAEPTPAAAPAKPHKYRMALDGDEEREYSLEEIRANYKKGKSAAQMMTKAEQRLRLAQEKEAQAQAREQRFANKAERRKVIEEMGYDPREFAEELLLPDIQREMMTEEQRRYFELQQKLEGYEREKQEREESEKQTAYEKQVEQYRENLGKSFVDALVKAGMPKESAPWLVKRMAAIADQHFELDENAPLNPDELAEMAKEDSANELRSMVGALDGEGIVRFFGPEIIKKVRAFDLAQLRSRQPGNVTTTKAPQRGLPTPSNGVRKTHYLTPDEARRQTDQLIHKWDSE